MKKALMVAAKCIAFVILWMLAISLLIPDLSLENPAIENLLYELIPLLYTAGITALFVLAVERKSIRIPIGNDFGRNTLLGLLFGVCWIGIPVVAMLLLGVIRFDAYTAVPHLAVWIAACFLNVVMQELLVRGYLYQRLKKSGNVLIAGILTTAFFTLLHGGAFEAGWVAVLNVLTMSAFVTLLLEYTGSLVAPIVAHFLWNAVGGIGLGAVQLGFAYPSLLAMISEGNAWLSGGAYKLEGSIVVLLVNSLLIACLLCLLHRKRIPADI